MTCCPIFEIFDKEHLLVKEYEHWAILVSNRVKTLGNCVVITKAHHERFSELDKQEMVEFNTVVKDLEKSLKKLWRFDEINWLMLMMKDHHTHFHVFPRYKEAREFAGIPWKDEFHPNILAQSKLEVDLPVLQKVRDSLREVLPDQ